jgi:hypothetical protein
MVLFPLEFAGVMESIYRDDFLPDIGDRWLTPETQE